MLVPRAGEIWTKLDDTNYTKLRASWQKNKTKQNKTKQNKTKQKNKQTNNSTNKQTNKQKTKTNKHVNHVNHFWQQVGSFFKELATSETIKRC